MGVTRDGEWASITKNGQSMGAVRATIHSKSVPHMYFFVVMDCTNNIQRTFQNSNLPVPRLLTEITMLNVIGGVPT